MLSRYAWTTACLAALIFFAGGVGAQAGDSFEILSFNSPTGNIAREGKLYVPPMAQGRSPAVIFFHGTDGVDQRYDYHRTGLLNLGIAVFELDFKTGIYKSGADRPKAEFFYPLAFAALGALRANPKIDPNRIASMGWSAGATISVGVALTGIQKQWLPNGEKPFAAYVGLYGGCNSQRGSNGLDGAPILVLQGTDDTLVPVERCVTFQKQFRNVEFVAYKGVHHEFDKEGANVVERNGDILRWNQEAAEDARNRIRTFLVKSLKVG